MKNITAHWLNLRRKMPINIVVLLVVIGGLISSATLFVAYERAYRIGQKELVTAIASALTISTSQSYRIGTTDIIDAQLQDIHQGNPNITAIYVVTGVTGQTTLTSEPGVYSPDSNSFFPDQARSKEYITQATNNPSTLLNGPVKVASSYGVAVYAPITNPDTKKVIGFLGVHINSQSHYFILALITLTPLLVMAATLLAIARQLKIQNKEQAILALKNQFVSIASHELRSPLTGILWAVQSLSRNASSKLTLEQLGLLTDVYRSTESSLATVNEILDMSIFERGKDGNLPADEFDLWMVIKQVEATLRLGAQEKKIRVEPTGNWPKHVPVIGDAGALKRAIMNIVSNAIKYSPEGSTIHLSYIHSTDGQHIIGVQDTGIGIPAEEQQQVLEGYYRATNARHVQANGTGLGLWVTRKIIEEHGGKLWLESELGKGTTIFLSLPKTLQKNNHKKSEQAK